MIKDPPPKCNIVNITIHDTDIILKNAPNHNRFSFFVLYTMKQPMKNIAIHTIIMIALVFMNI